MNNSTDVTKKEIWLPVKNYEGFYEVSNMGNVRSLRSGNLMTQFDDDEYFKVGLRKPKQAKKNLRVHRLVAEAFIPNPDNLPMVNHKNLDKTCNVVDNLEYCDGSYNMRHYSATSPNPVTGKATSCKKVVQYKGGKLVQVWPSTRETGRNGYNQSKVSEICRRKSTRTTHKECTWFFHTYVSIKNVV